MNCDCQGETSALQNIQMFGRSSKSRIVIPGVVGRKTGFSWQKRKNEVTTVNEWFESSDEDEPAKQSVENDENAASNSSQVLKLEVSDKKRKSLLIDASLRNMTNGSFTQDMDLVDSFVNDDQSPSTVLPASTTGVEYRSQRMRSETAEKLAMYERAMLSDPVEDIKDDETEEIAQSQRSNKENVARDSASPPAPVERHRSEVLQDITAEALDEDAVDVADDSLEAEEDVEDNVSDMPTHMSAGNHLEHDKASLPSHIVLNETAEDSPATSRRKSISFKADLAEHRDVDYEAPVYEPSIDHDDYEPADDYGDNDNGAEDDNQVDDQESFKKPSASKKPEKKQKSRRKSILKNANEPLRQEDMPTDLSRSKIGVKLFEKGGLKEVETEEGVVKRSSRMKYAPLEFWRNEKVVFGRRKSGLFPVPVIHEVIRVPEDQNNFRRSRTVKRTRKADDIEPKVEFLTKKGKTDEHVLLTAGGIEPPFKTVQNETYKIAKLLHDPGNKGLFSGMMLLPKGSEKPERESGEMTIFGFVHSGEVEVGIHETTAVISKGGSFVVPKYNKYKFSNTGNRDASIFIVNDRREE
eukprot:Partr_v1_DN28134_c2_g1_i4_m55941 putative centromeric DNA binding